MRRRRSKHRLLDKFVFGTCNTIDDVTGMKVKLNKTFTRWDGVVTTKLNNEPRQPQDKAVTPRPQRVYREARSEQPDPAVTPYDPSTGWGDLT